MECEPVADCRTPVPVEPRQPLEPVVTVPTAAPVVLLPPTGGGGLALTALALLVAGAVCVLAGKRKQPRPVEMPGGALEML